MTVSIDRRPGLLGLSEGEQIYGIGPKTYIEEGKIFVANPMSMRHLSSDHIANALKKHGYEGVRVVNGAFTREGERIESNMDTVVFTRVPEPQT